MLISRLSPVFPGLLLLFVAGCAGTPEPAPSAPSNDGAAVVNSSELESQELVDRLRAADQALREGNAEAAIAGYERVLSRMRTSTPTVETIRSSLMEAQYIARRYDAALETSQKILDGDPSAATIQRALERRYEIGLGFLNGATRRVLGLSVSAEGRGLEVLDELSITSPAFISAEETTRRRNNSFSGCCAITPQVRGPRRPNIG